MDELTHSNATENKEDDCQMAERKMSMKNRMKQLSALVLAATMAMGTYTSAFAADMTVYLRSIGKGAAQPTSELSLVIHNVDSRMSLYDALDTATVANKMLDANCSLSTKWSTGTNEDGSIDMYLTSLSASNGTDSYSKANNGGNTKLYKDEKGNYVGGYYEGNSWMWRMADATSYPEDITLSDQKCKDVDFAIVLSYDYSSFSWGTVTDNVETPGK